jgi:hypothetical protein
LLQSVLLWLSKETVPPVTRWRGSPPSMYLPGMGCPDAFNSGAKSSGGCGARRPPTPGMKKGKPGFDATLAPSVSHEPPGTNAP